MTQIIGELGEEGRANSRQVGDGTSLVFIWVETVVRENEYMAMSVVEIYVPNRCCSSPT
jgi:hypothetical protein